MKVVVQAGTLSVLVKILVQGLIGVSVSVAEDNGEMSLRKGISRELVLDWSEFARVWWNVFRSFAAPLAFVRFVMSACVPLCRWLMCWLASRSRPSLPVRHDL